MFIHNLLYYWWIFMLFGGRNYEDIYFNFSFGRWTKHKNLCRWMVLNLCFFWAMECYVYIRLICYRSNWWSYRFAYERNDECTSSWMSDLMSELAFGGFFQFPVRHRFVPNAISHNPIIAVDHSHSNASTYTYRLYGEMLWNSSHFGNPLIIPQLNIISVKNLISRW